jgi:hypothetical protein
LTALVTQDVLPPISNEIRHHLAAALAEANRCPDRIGLLGHPAEQQDHGNKNGTEVGKSCAAGRKSTDSRLPHHTENQSSYGCTSCPPEIHAPGTPEHPRVHPPCRQLQGRKKSGARTTHTFWTLGAHDGAILFEAPNDAVVTALMVALAGLGNVQATTLRAFTAAEFDAIVEKAPKL